MQYSKSASTTSTVAVEEMFTELFQKGETFLRPRWEKVEEEVRRSPTKALLVAAGIGYILHRLPVRSLLATNLKLLWALAPPAVIALVAGKGLQALDEHMHAEGRSPKPSARRTAEAAFS